MDESNLDLDHILLNQYHAAKRQRKLVDRLMKLMKGDGNVVNVSEALDKRIAFFESMIEDKSILTKKVKRLKCIDVLEKNPLLEYYRYGMYVTLFGYQIFWDSMKVYMKQYRQK